MWRCVFESPRRLAWVTALAVALCSATPSHAGLVLDFDLSGSSLSLGTLINVSDGMGATVSGSARIELTGVDARGVLTGPMAQGTLSRLDLNFELNTPIFSGIDASLLGPVRISQVGMATGAFDGTTLLANGFNGTFSTSLACAGSACPILSSAGMIMFPIVQNISLASPLAITLGNLGSRSPARLDASLMGMNNVVAFRVGIRGQAPEPTELGLLGLGALALCGGAALRRLRLG